MLDTGNPHRSSDRDILVKRQFQWKFIAFIFSTRPRARDRRVKRHTSVTEITFCPPIRRITARLDSVDTQKYLGGFDRHPGNVVVICTVLIAPKKAMLRKAMPQAIEAGSRICK